MRYVIDPEERTIAVVEVGSVAELVRANLFVEKFKEAFGSFTVVMEHAPILTKFKEAKFPDAKMDKGPQA